MAEDKSQQPTQPLIEVVHISQHPDAVYIGRAWAGRAASPLGNPFRSPGAIERYHTWLRAEYRRGERSAAYRELMRLVELYRAQRCLKLGCWCRKNGTDEPCHGDIVKLAVEGIIKKKQADK